MLVILNKKKFNVGFLFLALVLSLLWSSFASARFGRAQSPIRVALVVQSAEFIEKKCIELNQPNPTGYDVLANSGYPLITDVSGMGITICSINNTGCPANNCFCQSYSPPYYYWSYWRLQNGKWVYSPQGASNATVSDGSVEAWLWGDGRTPPQSVTFEEVCGPQLALPSATSTSTPTPSRTWTSTATQTSTLPAAATNQPSESHPAPTATRTRRVVSSNTPLSLTTQLNISTPTPILYTNTPLSPQPSVPPGISTSPSLPSPTITLAYGFLVKKPTATAALPQEMILTPTAGFDLQSFSLTATSIAQSRQQPAPSEASSDAGFSDKHPLLKSGLVSFGGFTAGLVLIMIFYLRRRR